MSVSHAFNPVESRGEPYEEIGEPLLFFLEGETLAGEFTGIDSSGRSSAGGGELVDHVTIRGARLAPSQPLVEDAFAPRP
jgi:hypothetical protein